MKIGIQGAIGSFSEEASKNLLKTMELKTQRLNI